MNRDFSERYAKIAKIVASGRIGDVQACVFSVNTAESKEAVLGRISAELDFATSLLRCKRADKESREFSDFPYAHGTVAREYDGGAIVRYTYTAAPIKESTQITLYGSDGELRFSDKDDKIMLYKQFPDYEGDEYTE